MKKEKVILIILDGWGLGDQSKSDAIFTANTPFMDSLYQNYPHSKLFAHGKHVGLPDGQMGNSEVGHSNIGAGRVLFQDLMRINNDIETNKFGSNETLVKAFEYAKQNKKSVHFIGLVSNGGVHSVNTHLYALADLANSYKNDNVFIHAITDGRDTDPRSGIGFIKELEENINGTNVKIATIVGRYYAMDRDKRWERVKIAYDLYVDGIGTGAKNAVEAMENSYQDGVTDEFIKPIVMLDEAQKPLGTIKEDDVVICFNFRTDRLRELTFVLTQKDMPEFQMKKMPLYYVTMANYDESFNGIHILYEKDNVFNSLGEVLANHGRAQLRIAETEKYPHVTFFFSGGREATFSGEERIMVSSPKVATYDLQPEMSAPEVTEKVIAQINTEKFDFICLNFANCDMVGHTGIYEAIIKAIETVDSSVKQVINAAIGHGYTAIVTADHGNSDFAINADGSPNTEHSLNQVPCILISDSIKNISDGVLADLAPTILKILHIPIPAEMTAKALV